MEFVKGVEIGPLEATINNLNKSIFAKQNEIENLEHDWLKKQNELVKTVSDKENLSKAVTQMSKQLSLLTQKKIRINSEFLD